MYGKMADILPTENCLNIKDWSVWPRGYYDNTMQEFIIKFLNNLLPINTRLSHYVQGQNRDCTFCRMTYFGPNPDENMIHLFFDCPITARWRKYMLQEVLHGTNNWAEKKEVWFSIMDNPLLRNEFFQVLKWNFLYAVWYFKLQRKPASNATFLNELSFRLKNCLKKSGVLLLKARIFNNHLIMLQAPG